MSVSEGLMQMLYHQIKVIRSNYQEEKISVRSYYFFLLQIFFPDIFFFNFGHLLPKVLADEKISEQAADKYYQKNSETVDHI